MVKPAAALLVAIIACAAVARAAAPSVGSSYSKAYNECMSAAGGSTYPMRDCISAEHDRWDKALNQVYQALIADRAGPRKNELRDDERAWLKRTRQRCDHAGDDEAGGSLEPLEIDQCYLDETIRRTAELRAMR
jgi:uncharacterized protein YecT (DUF1311 family)